MSRTAIILAVALVLGATVVASAPAYRVRPGDSLTTIAAAHGTTVARLARLNRLDPAAVLPVGLELRLSAARARPAHAAAVGQSYRVQPGDTLTSIATHFGTSAAAVARASRISLSSTILAGSVLRVPVPAAARRSKPTPAVRYVIYSVRPGDTLTAIAQHAGIGLVSLAGSNHLSLAEPLLIGTKLKLPAPAASTSTVDPDGARSSIAYWARHYGVDPKLALAVAWMESGFNNTMVSPAGALGVMQVTPDTWSYVEDVLLLGRSVPRTQDGNVRVGVAFLHHLLRIYDGDEEKALASYYQGIGSYLTYGLLPGTQQYIDDVLALKARF